MIRFTRRITFFTFFLMITAGGLSAQNKFDYSNQPVRKIFEDIQEKTPWRFLYRESLISDIRLSISSNEDELFQRMDILLNEYGLRLDVDAERFRVLLLQEGRNQAVVNHLSVYGQVVDAETGERLPHATVSWVENGRLKGISTGSAGTFHFTTTPQESRLTVKASYVGYSSEEIHLQTDAGSEIRDLTIRLKPESIRGNEIVISGTSFYASSDSTFRGLIETGRFSPFGESNAVRALQVLPSVGITTALNDGLNIRGSSPDGLLVMLDGITVFNQSHLFGLLDSFNEDALQSSGFFYDVTPAQVESPTGGTLSLITRTGSLNNTRAKAGISNSSYKATIEGPLMNGKASWLISGRGSLLNTVDWFNNSDLVQWGLDINRPSSLDKGNFTDLNSSLVTPLNSDAEFFDLHGKLYFEGNSGSRWIASVYYGGDFTKQLVDRRVRSFTSDSRFENQEFKTENEWGNFTGTLKHQRQISDVIYSHTMAGISSYESDFLKEDFVYTRINRSDGLNQINIFTFPFRNQSTMNQFKAEQSFDFVFNSFSLTAGASFFYYRGDYSENSFERSSFLIQTESSQADVFLQADFMELPMMNLHLGSRFHYYEKGGYNRFSPRAKLRLLPNSPVSFGVGFSRNHQFLHRVGLDNAVTSDIWILTNEQQSPSSVDHYSAGIYMRILPKSFLQVEGYIKNSKNLRLHEINVQTLSNTFSNTPWFFENEGRARGIEVLSRHLFNKWSFTQTYSLSSMELQNPFILNGESFYADWDRTHSYTATAELKLTQFLNFYTSWIVASGTPDNISLNNIAGEAERLGIYKRLDITLNYSDNLLNGMIDANISFYNVLDSQNPWYREFALAINENRRLPRLEPVPVTVFDLGFQPSFEIVFSF